MLSFIVENSNNRLFHLVLLKRQHSISLNNSTKMKQIRLSSHKLLYYPNQIFLNPKIQVHCSHGIYNMEVQQLQINYQYLRSNLCISMELGLRNLLIACNGVGLSSGKICVFYILLLSFRVMMLDDFSRILLSRVQHGQDLILSYFLFYQDLSLTSSSFALY